MYISSTQVIRGHGLVRSVSFIDVTRHQTDVSPSWSRSFEICLTNKVYRWLLNSTLCHHYTQNGQKLTILKFLTPRWRHVYTVFAYTWRHRASGKEMGVFYNLFWRFLQIWPRYIFSQKSKCAHHPRTRRHPCAKFDVLGPSQSWDIVWRINSHSPRDPDTQLISPWVNLSTPHWEITEKRSTYQKLN